MTLRLRTLTAFLNPGDPIQLERVRGVADALRELQQMLVEAQIEVQTLRLATPPVATWIGSGERALVTLAQRLEDACFVSGIGYASLGPWRPGDDPALAVALPDALGATSTIFATVKLTADARHIDREAILLAADAITRCATLTPDGFGNLRFGALARVPAYVPFLPAAYAAAPDGADGAPIDWRSGAYGLGIGVEAAPLAVAALEGATTLEQARQTLIASVESHAAHLEKIVKTWARRRRVQFFGFDFAWAQYPTPERSLGTALERISGVPVGMAGTLSAAALLTEALDRANFKRTGYNGLFLPVLEDSVLARRAAEGTLCVNDLLLYSAVCGTGLDTVPLPGDTRPTQIAALLADVAALAVRLDKPLSARLMPIPGKSAGDAVAFDFEYFAPSRVLAAESIGLGGLLATDARWALAGRRA
ncbi:MAG: DUF711 family protein [Anaerolineales bacterium]|nr:DUF711 family protein [Anaerolineales bacterium]